MPHYSETFTALKPLVEKQNFSGEQLTIINKLMRGCWKLRQAKLCSTALSYAIPDDFEIVENTNITKESTYNGVTKTYHPVIVKRKDEELPKDENAELDEATKEAMKTGEIA